MNELSSCRILIIDDDEDSRFLLQCLLEKLCQIETAANAAEGLHKARQSTPDLVLLDINMPGEDGFSVCRRLRANPETSITPVIFITASTDMEDMVQGFAAGAVDYLNKPFDISEVNARVTAQLRQQLIIQERSHRLGKLSKALASLEQSYLFFADHSADVLIRCGGDGIVRHINRQWTQLSGLQGGNPIGRPVEELAIEQDRALVRASLDEALDQRREQLRLEFSIPTPAGPCPVRGSFLFHREPEGRCLEINAVLSDLSDILNSDMGFKTTQNAVRMAAAAHLTYLENISHEVRTPLNGIFGAVTALEESESLAPEIQETIHTLGNETRRLETLLTTMLAARPAPPNLLPTSAEMPILIVDDIPSNLKVLQLALRGLGFKNVQTALSGEEGWAAWQQNFHSLVLLDYRMDGMSGYELCQLIRRHEKGGTPFILGVSANALPENEAKAAESGFNAQIAKPVSRLKLRAALEGFGVKTPTP